MTLHSSNQVNLYSHGKYLNELTWLYSMNKLPNKILLSGEKGIGKCTLAYHLINFILSADENESYDSKKFLINRQSKVFKLIQNKSNPNFNLIDLKEDKKNIDINQIRELISKLNKSSFNDKPRFVLIDNIEFLNDNSVNALLKILEEPNDKIYFILINNNKKVLPTLKSRCLNFKIFLKFEEKIKIINEILGNNVLDLLNSDFINNYFTPGELLKLINFGKDNKIDLKKNNLKEFLSVIIKDNKYKNQTYFKNSIYLLIELYFRINTSVNNIKLINIYSYFLKKIHYVKKFNLDEDTLLMEFEYKVLNG